jgi:hypothetical protein
MNQIASSEQIQSALLTKADERRAYLSGARRELRTEPVAKASVTRCGPYSAKTQKKEWTTGLASCGKWKAPCPVWTTGSMVRVSAEVRTGTSLGKH